MFCKSSKAWPRGLICEYRSSLDEEAYEHLKFICAVYKWQVSRKWYFLHEHPASAVSWRLPLIKAVRVLEGVECIVGDQCVHGQEVPGRGWAGIWGGGLTNLVIR